MNILTTIAALAASGFGLWALFKYVILVELRVDANTFKTIYDLCKEDRKFMIQEEFISETRYPVTYIAICFFKGAPWFYMNHGERLLTAGWQGKDYVTIIVCFRWRYKKMKDYLKIKLKEMQLHSLGVPVELMLPHYTDKIGTLKHEIGPPLLDESLWKDFANEVAEVADGKRMKTSALLYGPPGNAKSSTVKYLATKYRLPIMILTFNPDWNNHELLLLFSQIPNRCIVLLEDFDNYFDGRQCIIKSENIKFTFDMILNGLDGVYNTYENVVFIMTVNDINKVDPAIRNRPSRFKFTRCFDNPPLNVRKKLLIDQWAEMTEGLNIDQIYRMKEYYDQGMDFRAALVKLEKEIGTKEIEKLAFNRFEERLKSGLDGDHQADWFHILNGGKK